MSKTVITCEECGKYYSGDDLTKQDCSLYLYVPVEEKFLIEYYNCPHCGFAHQYIIYSMELYNLTEQLKSINEMFDATRNAMSEKQAEITGRRVAIIERKQRHENERVKLITQNFDNHMLNEYIGNAVY